MVTLVSLISIERAVRLAALFTILFVSATAARAVPIVGLKDFNQIIIFDSAAPGTVISGGTISGIPGSDRLIAIDFRPATGQLYGLSLNNRLYVINPTTRVATQIVGRASFSPSLNASQAGFDFDPTIDQIRVTSLLGQNLRLNPDPVFGGDATQDTPIAFAPGDSHSGQVRGLYGLAYSNNFSGASQTVAYGIEISPGKDALLVALAPPNSGLIHTIGSVVNFPVTEEVGFDIAPVSGTAYAALKIASPNITSSGLYSINLTTGAATSIGTIDNQPGIILDIAVAPPPLTIFANNSRDELIKFDSANPETILRRVPLRSVPHVDPTFAVTDFANIDFRPQTGKLYAFAHIQFGGRFGSQVLTVETDGAEMGLARDISSGFHLDPEPLGSIGFDFDPVTDRLRIVTSTKQNLQVFPDLGLVEHVDTSLAYAASDRNAGRDPQVIAAAHSNNFPGATSTTLFDIDRDTSLTALRLATQGSRGGSPVSSNTGQLFGVGSVGFGVPVDFVGFDIAPGAEGRAFVTTISMDEGFSRLTTFNANRSGGSSSLIGVVGEPGNVERIRDLAVQASGTFQFSAASYSVLEDCTAVKITVTRSGDTSNEATVDFAATEPTSGTFINPASSRSDYNAAFGTLLFAAGETSKTFSVLINEDSLNEKLEGQQGESALLTLGNPTGGFTLGNQRTAALVILDDQSEPSSNAIDDTRTFVCQQYHDFLNREPDDAGLTFWTNNIESCGADADCRQIKRIDTSAAFFLSGEFQETGFLVYRTYQAAFARTPVALKLEEFLPDTQDIGRDIIVGASGAQQALEANKRAYFDAFVMRADFEASYPLTLTPAQYVLALDANTGNSLLPAERDALANGINNGTETRATVLRKVAENVAFRRRELTRAFVLMQYFGYLRRNPNDPPDNDFSGYNFWLAKLDEFGGDFRRADMVKAFITSSEYRRRFGL